MTFFLLFCTLYCAPFFLLFFYPCLFFLLPLLQVYPFTDVLWIFGAARRRYRFTETTLHSHFMGYL